MDETMEVIETVETVEAPPAEVVAERIAAPVAELTDADLIAQAINEVETDDARREAYAEAAVETVSLDATPAATGTPVAARKVRVSFSKKSEAILAKLGADPEKMFVLEASDANLDETALKAKMDATLEAINDLPKKVGEKAANIFAALAGKSRVSGYTGYVLEALARDGQITSKAAFELLQARGYKDGTARAQSNQMFQLFPALGIAKRENKGTLVLNQDSTLVDVLKAMIAKPASAPSA